MNRAFSTYLDFTRFAAAATVVLHHLGAKALTAGSFDPVGAAGEDAVMVFFVLSGYVIAYVSERDRSLADYAINRLARLYSVVVPALLLTVVADTIGSRANPGLYEGMLRDSHALAKTALSLTFMNQIWSFDFRFFSNVPYWSISYEFWYYVLFACAFFAKGATRVVLFIVWAVFVGPCILLLLPVWWLGVLTFRYTNRRTLSLVPAWLCFTLPIPVYLAYRAAGIDATLTSITDAWVMQLTGDLYYLHKARFFLHDYLVGLLVVAHIIGAHGIAATRRPEPRRMDRIVRGAAGYTFSTYLYHYPTLYCLAALSPFAKESAFQVIFLLAGTAAIVMLLGPVTEGRKEVWRAALSRLYARVQLVSQRIVPRFALPLASKSSARTAEPKRSTQWLATAGVTVLLFALVLANPIAPRGAQIPGDRDAAMGKPKSVEPTY